MLDPAIQPISHFDGARDALRPADRLREVRARARAFHDELMAAPPVAFYRSVELVRAPYPTKYAFLNVPTVPVPMIHIVNRMFVVQVETDHGLRTILVSPTDHESASRTPFFDRLSRSFGPLATTIRSRIAPVSGTVESRLQEMGLSPSDVDYLTFDHLHTQDVRRWLGTRDRPGVFPRARLLVMRQEWESSMGLIGPQVDWYRPSGIEDVPPERVVLLDGDVRIGRSLALIRTPGHTEGNHSVVARTPGGVFVTSENGVGPDAYAPLASGIPGMARFARETGVEVVMNGNTLERGLDQYLSMIQEKEMAGPSAADPRFPNLACSSEFDEAWFAPGIRPTFRFGDLSWGTLRVGAS